MPLLTMRGAIIYCVTAVCQACACVQMCLNFTTTLWVLWISLSDEDTCGS